MHNEKDVADELTVAVKADAQGAFVPTAAIPPILYPPLTSCEVQYHDRIRDRINRKGSKKWMFEN